MLRRVKGAVVVRCCWTQLCTVCCVCVRFPSDLRASRCGDSRGGAQQGWAGPVSPLAAGGRGDTEGQTGERGTGSAPSCSPALPAPCRVRHRHFLLQEPHGDTPVRSPRIQNQCCHGQFLLLGLSYLNLCSCFLQPCKCLSPTASHGNVFLSLIICCYNSF